MSEWLKIKRPTTLVVLTLSGWDVLATGGLICIDVLVSVCLASGLYRYFATNCLAYLIFVRKHCNSRKGNTHGIIAAFALAVHRSFEHSVTGMFST
jgi:hypothetical protein